MIKFSAALVAAELCVSAAHAQQGMFGPVTYGTDISGDQGAAEVIDVVSWPDLVSSQDVQRNTVGVDAFCAAQGLKPNGALLIGGGSQTINGQRNYGRATAAGATIMPFYEKGNVRIHSEELRPTAVSSVALAACKDTDHVWSPTTPSAATLPQVWKALTDASV